MTRTITTACPRNCYSTCGLRVTVAGEILDRAHFYGSLEVTTPRIRMAGDLAAGRAEGAHA